MGQQEVSNILKHRYPDYLGLEELSFIVDTSKAALCHSLRKLRKRDEIEFIIIRSKKPKSGLITLYRYKEEIT